MSQQVQATQASQALSGGFIGVIQTHGVFTQRFTGLGVSRSSVVVVSICEGTFDQPFMGDAVMKVYNVVPENGGSVLVRGEVVWETDLNVRVSFLVA